MTRESTTQQQDGANLAAVSSSAWIADLTAKAIGRNEAILPRPEPADPVMQFEYCNCPDDCPRDHPNE